MDRDARRACRPGSRDRVLPRRERLAVAGGPSGRFGEIKIWDVHQPKPKLRSTIHGHRDTILAIAFSPDGKSIASASYDKLVKVWDVDTGKQLKSLKEHTDAVYAVAFMPDGKRLVSAAGDRTLKVWDVAAGTRLTTVNDALDSLYAVAVNPAGTQIAAAGADRMSARGRGMRRPRPTRRRCRHPPSHTPTPSCVWRIPPTDPCWCPPAQIAS